MSNKANEIYKILNNVKQSKVTISERKPSPNDGDNGSMHLATLSTGPRLYIKNKNKWMYANLIIENQSNSPNSRGSRKKPKHLRNIHDLRDIKIVNDNLYYIDPGNDVIQITDADKVNIKDDQVTYAKIQNVTATDRILGRDSAGAGEIEEISPASLRTMINVEDGADVTDATNVTAAGALMDSEVTNLSQVKSFDSSDYATAAQGSKADSAQQPPSEGAFVNGDKTKLDGIASGATANAGDITGVTLTADDSNVASDTAGSADFTIAGGEGIDTSVSGTTVSIAGEDASTTNKGVVELATSDEVTTGTDSSRAVTPSALGSSTLQTRGHVVTGPTLTSAASDDKLISATQILNVSAGSLGTQEYRMIKTNLTETNVGGWDKVYLIDQQVGGTSKFNVDNSGNFTVAGNINLANDQNLYLGSAANNDYIYSDGNFINIARDDTDTIQIRDTEIRSEIPIKITEQASANTDTAGKGQIWVKNDTPNNLYFTNDAGNDVQITNGSSLAGGSGGATKHYMDWHYNSANLSSTNTFYANTHIDDFAVSSSINTGITDYNDTEASDIWRIVRFARRIPYSGTITKVITHVESSGASADSDIEIGVWIASISSLSLDTQLATTTNVAIDNLAKIDFDFDTATRFMFKETTSFNATSLTASDFMFITMRRTSGTDGSSFNCHTTVLYDGS